MDDHFNESPPIRLLDVVGDYLSRLRELDPSILNNIQIEISQVERSPNYDLRPINYYLYANTEFKEKIGDNKELIVFYNSSCSNLFSRDYDFIGKFTPHYIYIAYNTIKENYETIIKSICVEFKNFLDTIFIPIITRFYEELNRKKHYHVTSILEKHSIKIDSIPLHTDTGCCPICFDDIKSTDCDKYIKFPCNHTFHYNCMYNWAMASSKITCPVCRKKIE